MRKFKFEFTEEQINYIINVLATRPYSEVQGILALIQQQGSNQSAEEVTLEKVED